MRCSMAATAASSPTTVVDLAVDPPVIVRRGDRAILAARWDRREAFRCATVPPYGILQSLHMSANPQTRRVLSGMRPTGPLHLGNFHGALRNWVELQYQYECFFFVADWHALTTGYEDTGAPAGVRPGGAHRLAGRRPEPRRRDAVHAVPGARARRTASAAVDDHAAGLARARADLQGPAGAAEGQGSRHLRLPRLSAAAERRHPAVPAGLRAGRRGPGRARRDHARDRAPLQPSLRPRAGFRGEGRKRGQELWAAAMPRCTGSCAASYQETGDSEALEQRARAGAEQQPDHRGRSRAAARLPGGRVASASCPSRRCC